MKIIFLKLLLTGFLLFTVACSYAQSKDLSPEHIKEFLNLTEKGNKANKSGNYPLALELHTKAELIGEKYRQDEYTVVSKLNIGTAYNGMSNYGDALQNYREALTIAEKYDKFQDKSIIILNNISNIYGDEGEFALALQYYERAYKKALKLKSGFHQLLTAVNISSLYNKQSNYSEARKYLLLVREFLTTDTADSQIRELIGIYYINYAETFLLEGRPEEALKILTGASSDLADGQSRSVVCYVCSMELLSRIYDKMGKTADAIAYANKGLANAKSFKDKIGLYEQISNIYHAQKNYITAFKYRDSVVMIKDSLSASVSRGLFEANKIKLRIQDYQSEVKHNKEKQEAERMLFILIIAIGMLLFLFIYLGLRNRIIKQKQEKIIAENHQQIIDLELQNLSNNITEKNSRLSAKALYLSNRNELIEDMINTLAKIPEVSGNKNITAHIKTLRDHIKADAEWDDFIMYFEQVNPNFLRMLQEKHPQLTPADIRFICYLYMNLDLKEISSIFSITIEAAKKRKQRVAKKMELEMDDLQNYLLKLG